METGLYVIRHIEFLELDEWLASHSTFDAALNQTVSETLVEATPVGIDHIRANFPVLSIERAEAGRFEDDTVGTVVVHEDGTYTVEEE